MAQDQDQKAGMADVTLYSLCLGPVSQRCSQIQMEHDLIPGNVLIDIFTMIAEDGNEIELAMLKSEMSKVQVLMKLMQVKLKRDKLHKIFKTMINRDITQAISNMISPICVPTVCRNIVESLVPARLAENFEEKCLVAIKSEGPHENLLKMGMQLGEFLCEAGWYEEGEKVLGRCIIIVSLDKNELRAYQRSIKFLEKLLVAQVSYSLHSHAQITFETARDIIEKLKDAKIKVNLAGIYSAFSSLSFLECSYNDALDWSIKALEELKEVLNCTETRAIVDILRQAAKSCVVKREFHKAELLIKEAVYLARDVYGSKSVKYADTLLDFGYYLLNRDSVRQAVTVYRECFSIREAAYGSYNLMTAVVLEDLSYALYVLEYNSGNFDEARSLSQKAINTMDVLLPLNHLQLASVKRVKALILEEVAIDSHGTPVEKDLLKEAEKLHQTALKLSQRVFGEMNVQIAKHYGNLGRLYQSMRKYQDAEEMHLKAISIKEKLLGLYDYEVALSVGHLASLYNYDMEQYRKAEELHLRSISIGKRLFGDAYSGLEYDYRGLMQIYSVEANADKYAEYSLIFTQWRMLRDLKAASSNDKAVSEKQVSQPVSKVIEDFFTIKWINSNN